MLRKNPMKYELYYHLRPYLPLPVRMALRRGVARQKRLLAGATWPISPSAAKAPANWPGWPDGKRFAFVLSHDVEGPKGLDRCRELMSLESSLGFRSSFNLIPEGPYVVPKSLRDELTNNGFEVGVHDLKHDGKLYASREVFSRHAESINRYLKDWGAAGFRSGFMHHNLEWLQDLEVQYDASTFDTDPFEPQPDGVNTIFPFRVQRANGSDFIELPYTLPQDSTLFLILGETTTSVWRKKLDWLVQQGGMVLLDTHPDYMNFSGVKRPAWEYSVSLYHEFLEHVRTRYAGMFWHATPREVAEYANRTLKKPSGSSAGASLNGHHKSRGKIWIDLDNTPHVPLFAPIVEELSKRGYEVLLTARDAFQVCELAEQKGMHCLKIGRHHGKNRFRKVTGLFYRASQLAPIARREKPILGLSHGSRSQIIACNLLGIPTMLMADYEYAKYPPLMRPTWEMVPAVIPDDALYCRGDRVKRYPGIKEDVYVPGFTPDAGLLNELGLTREHSIVVVRPPATEAHYHNPESEKLFVRFMERACQAEKAVRVVLLPRNKKQGEFLQANWPHWFADQRTMIPKTAVDGLNLLWHSDLVVSGGGTMNREAAALGVPVYSVFRGRIGAVDHHLQKEGRLVLIQSLEDVDRIAFTRRNRNHANGSTRSAALESIVDHIEEVIAFHRRAKANKQ